MMWNEILVVCWRDENEALCDAIIYARTLSQGGGRYRNIFESGRMHYSTRTAKKTLYSINITSRHKIDPGTPQQASEMQYPLVMAEFTNKVNSVNSEESKQCQMQ